MDVISSKTSTTTYTAMKSYTPTQPVLFFSCRMRPASLQTWQVIPFDLNLCGNIVCPRGMPVLQMISVEGSQYSQEGSQMNIMDSALVSFFNTVTTGQRNNPLCESSKLPMNLFFFSLFQVLMYYLCCKS